MHLYFFVFVSPMAIIFDLGCYFLKIWQNNTSGQVKVLVSGFLDYLLGGMDSANEYGEEVKPVNL